MMRNTKENICAIIVTYNRKDLLIECLESLKKQSRPLEGIYIIDNASNDGTPELLKAKGYIKELPPRKLTQSWEKDFIIKVDNQTTQIHYVRMPENTGGAGGFYEGIKRAYLKGYSWFWLMDDDGFPETDCLEQLILYKEKADFLNPLVLSKENPQRLCCEIIDYGTNTRIKNLYQITKDIYYNTANPFNGTFIHRRLVQKIGLPKKEFFFWGDEIEYMLRAQKAGFKIATITKARFYHPKIKLKPIKVTDNIYISWVEDTLRRYLYFRNKSYILKKYFSNNDLYFFVYKYMLAFTKGLLNKNDLHLVIEAIVDGLLEIWGKERIFLKNTLKKD